MIVLTIISQLLLLLFHQATTLFDFYPFNNVRQYSVQERLLESGINGSMMVVPPIGYCLQVKWMVMAALVIYPVLLAGEYLNWWRHYFFGASKAWQETYDRLFKPTIIVLPPMKDHPVPNLEHTILHGLTLLTAILTYISYFTAL